MAKRQGDFLTPDEHKEFLQLNERLEKLQEKRLEYLQELANLHGIPFQQLMEHLGIKSA